MFSEAEEAKPPLTPAEEEEFRRMKVRLARNLRIIIDELPLTIAYAEHEWLGPLIEAEKAAKQLLKSLAKERADRRRMMVM